jgi:hypothetical protein
MGAFMNRSHRRRVFIGFAVLGIALTAGSSSADHAWNNYHWARTSNPFTLRTGDNVDAKWDAYLMEAIADWNQSGVVFLEKVTGAAKGKCRPTAGRIEVCNAAYGNNGWLGIAQIWISGAHITQGTTKLNDTYFNTATYNTPPWRRLVTCQEVAHDFGLAHQDENFSNRNLGSCMDYTSDPDGGGAFGPSNEHPNPHDFEIINQIYEHLDSSTTVGTASAPNGAPAAMNQIEFDGPGQWGQLVRSSRNGRAQIYELDFGKGHKVITHVFWADPEGDAHHH